MIEVIRKRKQEVVDRLESYQMEHTKVQQRLFELENHIRACAGAAEFADIVLRDLTNNVAHELVEGDGVPEAVDNVVAMETSPARPKAPVGNSPSQTR